MFDSGDDVGELLSVGLPSEELCGNGSEIVVGKEEA